MRKSLLLLWALAACGDDDAGLDLEERRFTLQSGREVVAGTTPTLTFDEGDLGFYAGCNSASGEYSIRGGKLVTQDLLATERGCATDLAAQDEFFFGFLRAAPSITLEGTQLTLTGDVTLVFTERP
jgi:heat shock protein HslJ